MLAVYWGLGYDLPLGWCLLLIAMSAWVNVGLRVIAGLMLAYLALAAVLAVTVNSRFFVNDVIALVVFAGLLATLFAIDGGVPMLARRTQPMRRPRGGPRR